MIKAWPVSKSEDYVEYYLSSDRSTETFGRRDIIKSSGGRWDASNKRWVVPEASLSLIGAVRMIKVNIEAHCHMPEETTFVTEAEFKAGQCRRGCPMCDTSEVCGKMVKIVGEVY